MSAFGWVVTTGAAMSLIVSDEIALAADTTEVVVEIARLACILLGNTPFLQIVDDIDTLATRPADISYEDHAGYVA